MKQISLIVMAAVIILLVGGCSGNRRVFEERNSEGKIESGYEFESEKIYSPSDCIEIVYPYYATENGIGNAINQTIEHSIDEYLLGRLENINDYSLSMGYELMENSEKTLSILFTGVLDIENAAHPSYVFFTTNVVLPSATRTGLSDFVEIDDRLLEIVLTGEDVEDVSPLGRIEATREYLKKVEESILLEELQNTDSSSAWCSYVRNGRIGVVIPIPYAIGGFSQFEWESKHADVAG